MLTFGPCARASGRDPSDPRAAKHTTVPAAFIRINEAPHPSLQEVVDALLTITKRSVYRRHRVDCKQLGIHELGCEVAMFRSPSQDSTLKTKGLTIATSLQSNIFTVLEFGSSGRTRTYNPSVNSRMLYH